MSVFTIDMPELHAAIRSRLFRLEKTARETADLLQISPQVFTSIKHAATGGKAYVPSAPALLSICWWLGRPLSDFARRTTDVARPPIPVDRADPRTAPVLTELPDGAVLLGCQNDHGDEPACAAGLVVEIFPQQDTALVALRDREGEDSEEVPVSRAALRQVLDGDL